MSLTPATPDATIFWQGRAISTSFQCWGCRFEPQPSLPGPFPCREQTSEREPSGPERSLAGLLAEQLGASAAREGTKAPRWLALGLGAYVGLPAERWFQPGTTKDRDYPGGGYTRTRVVDGSCVFLNRRGRGCLIHKYCLEKCLDYH